MNNAEFAKKVLHTADYFGTLNATKSYRNLGFITPHATPDGKYHKYFNEYGDCVYFLIGDGKLLKVGKAQGERGWYSRVKQYKRGYNYDKTNRMVLNKMYDLGISSVSVYGVHCPRQIRKVYCPIFKKNVQVEVKTAENIEKRYLKMLKTKLELCVQHA